MQLVTVATFNYIHELAMARGPLEQEGIECFVKDEFTMQANPLYNIAIGGIKLQVYEDDVPRAVEILQELGYLQPMEVGRNAAWDTWATRTAKIPVVNRLHPVFRLLVLLVLISALLIVIAIIVNSPQ